MSKNKVFDPKLVSIIAGATPIRGLDPDSMLKIERDVPELYRDNVDAYGTPTRFKETNNTCSVTITLTQSSDGNDVFSNYMQLDKQSDAGTFPLSINDRNGKSLFFSKSAYIYKAPTVEFGNDNKTREWVIKATDMDMYVGGIS